MPDPDDIDKFWRFTKEEEDAQEETVRVSSEVPADLDEAKIATLVNLFTSTTIDTCTPREAITVYLNAIGRTVMLSAPSRSFVDGMIPHLQADVGSFLRAIWDEGVRDGTIPASRNHRQ